MSMILVLTETMLLVALVWSLFVMVKYKEWQIGSFSTIVGVLAAGPMFRSEMGTVEPVLSGSLGPVAGLVVSTMCLVAVAVIKKRIVAGRVDMEYGSQSSKTLGLQQAVQRKMIDGGTLQETLSELCSHAALVFPGAVPSVLLMDDKEGCLRFGAGPDVPKELAALFDGLVPSPAAGSCGTAAFTGEANICADTKTDPRWAEMQDIVQQFGLNACWSIPILGKGTQVLGTFALSFGMPCKPTEFHHQILRVSSDMASIAIQKFEGEAKQRKLAEILESARRMQSMAVLAGGVAHDLNNMLGPLVGYPELILRQLPEASKGRRQLKIMSRAAKQAASVIQDLLTLARRGRYEMAPVHLETIANRYFESPAFDEAQRLHGQVRVIYDIDPDAGMMVGSESHLTKTVMNLVNNAFEAMPSGGTLCFGIHRGQINELPGKYGGFSPGEYVVLSVSDTGTGIESSDLSRIFEPYFSRKKLGRAGSGLGLSVVRGVIKDHNGYYDVTSQKSEGTKFFLYFPVAAKRQVEGLGSSDVEFPRRGTERILVVDDDESQRVMAETVLDSLGYVVTTAASSEKAIRAVSESHYDLIVMDMIMDDGLDGLDTFMAILKHCPHQKVLPTSGYSATDRVERMQRLGGGAFLQKPYSMTAISSAIRRELGRDAGDDVTIPHGSPKNFASAP
jgi:signal transduction histidine kinase/CheY-like chemotaxis protein